MPGASGLSLLCMGRDSDNPADGGAAGHKPGVGIKEAYGSQGEGSRKPRKCLLSCSSILLLVRVCSPPYYGRAGQAMLQRSSSIQGIENRAVFGCFLE